MGLTFYDNFCTVVHPIKKPPNQSNQKFAEWCGMKITVNSSLDYVVAIGESSSPQSSGFGEEVIRMEPPIY